MVAFGAADYEYAEYVPFKCVLPSNYTLWCVSYVFFFFYYSHFALVISRTYLYLVILFLHTRFIWTLNAIDIKIILP